MDQLKEEAKSKNEQELKAFKEKVKSIPDDEVELEMSGKNDENQDEESKVS